MKTTKSSIITKTSAKSGNGFMTDLGVALMVAPVLSLILGGFIFLLTYLPPPVFFTLIFGIPSICGLGILVLEKITRGKR